MKKKSKQRLKQSINYRSTLQKGCLSDALPKDDDKQLSVDSLGLRSVSCNDIVLMEQNSRSGKTKSNEPPGVIIARSAETIFKEEKQEGKTTSEPWSWLRAIPRSSLSVITNETQHPFSGLLTSQLQCTNCKWKVSNLLEKVIFFVPQAETFRY